MPKTPRLPAFRGSEGSAAAPASGLDAAPQHVDSGLQLRDRRLRDGGTAADPAELGVHGAVRLAGLARVQTDEAVEQLPLLLQSAVQGLRRRRRGCCVAVRGSRLPRLAVPRLARLSLHEQIVNVLGF